MSHELHYTSAPRGLKAGSMGFCTVAASASLPGPLSERLEGLSGYRQVFPPGDPSAGLNPPVVSHLRLPLGNHAVDVLSRVGYAGLDYSDRGNKYAHHVAIDGPERPEGGPAWLASQPGFLESAWSGEPRILPAGRGVPRGDRPPGVCGEWARRFGDAGHAGAVAEAFLADPKRPVYVVFDPGDDVLPLFVEALALLPAGRRWDVSFSTYYTGQALGLPCLWRGVLRNSPEALQAERLPDAMIFDPRRPAAPASGGALVELARTGVSPTRPSETPARPSRPAASIPFDLEPEPPRRPGSSRPSRPRRISWDDGAYDLSTPPPSSSPRPRASRPRPASISPEERREQMLVKVWIGVAAALIVGLGGTMAYMLGGPKAAPPAVARGDLADRRDDPAEDDPPSPRPEEPRPVAKEPGREKIVIPGDPGPVTKANGENNAVITAPPGPIPPAVGPPVPTTGDGSPPPSASPSPKPPEARPRLESFYPLPRVADADGKKDRRQVASPVSALKLSRLENAEADTLTIKTQDDGSIAVHYPAGLAGLGDLGKFTHEDRSVIFVPAQTSQTKMVEGAYKSLEGYVLKAELEKGPAVYFLLRRPWKLKAEPVLLQNDCLKNSGMSARFDAGDLARLKTVFGSCVLRPLGTEKDLPPIVLRIGDGDRSEAVGVYRGADKVDVQFKIAVRTVSKESQDLRVSFRFDPESPQSRWKALTTRIGNLATLNLILPSQLPNEVPTSAAEIGRLIDLVAASKMAWDGFRPEQKSQSTPPDFDAMMNELRIIRESIKMIGLYTIDYSLSIKVSGENDFLPIN